MDTHVIKEQTRYDGKPDGIFLFALADFWARRAPEQATLAIDTPAYEPGSPGRIFKLDEDALIDLDEHRYRQTYMFSATMPPAVEKIARNYLRNPAYVYIGDQSSSKDNITQTIEFCKENQKKERLMSLLANGPPPPIIVFCNGKKGCDVLARSLDKQGFPTATIHSDASSCAKPISRSR